MLLNFFKSKSYKPMILDSKSVVQQYEYWRKRILSSLFIGYVFFYFTRKSYTFAMPILLQDLHYSNSDLGIIGTVLYISYGISKLVSGILSDKANPRYFMSIGLILTGVFNISFGLSSSIWFFIIFWGLNGWFQGWGWPPITKQLTHWSSKKERGLWWSICSSSHNVGGTIIPILITYCAQGWGWRYAMYVPGVMCIVVGCFLFVMLRDIPESLGLPPIEVYKEEIEYSKNNDGSFYKIKEERSLSSKEIFFDHVLKNKFIWLLACSYFFIYIVRTAINDWSIVYLVNQKNYKLVIAGACIFWFEIGGLFGMFVAGWLTDNIFNGNRIIFSFICSIGIIVFLFLFWYLPFRYVFIDFILMALLGFWVFGPQMLIGLAAAEMVNKKASCTANGFVGSWAYLGAAITGYPLGFIMDISWDAFFMFLMIASIFILLVMFQILYVVKKKND